MRYGAITLADSGVVSFEQTGTINSGVSAGVGQPLNLTGGTGSSGAGGDIVLLGGAPSTTNTPGSISLTGAAFGAGGTVGGNVTLRGGRGSVLANDGVVRIDRTLTDNRATRLRFIGDDGNTVDLKAPSVVTSYGMTWPGVQPAGDTFLQNPGSGVLAWAVGVTPATHLTLDQLVHSVVETSFEEYTYSGGKVSTIIVWTSVAKTLRVRDETFSYSGSKVSQIVTRQYNGAGAVVETMTEVFAYSGSNVADITRTFV